MVVVTIEMPCSTQNKLNCCQYSECIFLHHLPANFQAFRHVQDSSDWFTEKQDISAQSEAPGGFGLFFNTLFYFGLIF